MAASAKVFTNALIAFMDGTIKWKTSAGSAFKVALTTGWTPNQDTDVFWDDISAYEISGTGYTAGGQALVTADPTVDTGTNETRMDATDSAWTGSSLSATMAVVYQDTGTPSTSRLICYQDFDTTKTSVTGTFTIEWAATGVFKIAAA